MRGLCSKTLLFYTNSSDLAFDCLLITETWLNDSVIDSELFHSHYSVVRSDRRFGTVGRATGGGVLLALNNKYTYSVVDVDHIARAVPLIDLVLCKCFFGAFAVFVAVVYIPPNTSLDDLNLFVDALAVILLDHPVLFVGDFNLPNYRTGSGGGLREQVLDGFVRSLDLVQRNNIANHNNRLLDLVFASKQLICPASRAEFPLVPEDAHHPALTLECRVVLHRSENFPQSSNARYCFRRANYLQLYEDLCCADWTPVLAANDVDESLSRFYKILYDNMNRSIPTVSPRSSRVKYPTWFTSDIVRLLKLKEHYRRLFRRTASAGSLHEFRRLRAQTKVMISEAYRMYISRSEEGIQADPSQFWNFVNVRRGTTRIPGIMRDGDTVFDSPSAIVNAFASSFKSVYRDGGSPVVSDELSCLTYVPVPSVTESELIQHMKTIGSSMTAGNDLVPAFLIHDCRQVFAGPLVHIITLCLEQFTFPTAWKTARITPVFKKGDRAQISNYRPISILSNLSKICEKVLFSGIYGAVKSFLSPHQHGFVRGRSTTTNLCCFTQYVSEALDGGRQVDAVYTDFSRAFDCIDHSILLSKLSGFGFSPGLVRLLQSYLTDRKSYVYYNGFASMEFVVRSGVPQGSNLGPLLFNLFINDLITSLTCPVLAYADDLKLFSTICDEEDVETLQSNVNTIVTWCDLFHLRLNVGKCFVVTFSRSSSPIINQYSVESTMLRREEFAQDLGVAFDGKLSFVKHMENTCSAAFKMMGFIMRTVQQFTDVRALKVLFNAFVLSRLEYASVVWHPFYISHQLMMERVQRRFLKYLSYKLDREYPERGCSYEDLLARHGMQSLQKRREQSSAAYLRRLIAGAVDCPALMSRILFTVPRVGCRHHSEFYLPAPRTNLLLRSPIYQMCRYAERYE